jgi:hypothetical protein
VLVTAALMFVEAVEIIGKDTGVASDGLRRYFVFHR